MNLKQNFNLPRINNSLFVRRIHPIRYSNNHVQLNHSLKKKKKKKESQLITYIPWNKTRIRKSSLEEIRKRIHESRKEVVPDRSRGNPLPRCFRSPQEAMEPEKNREPRRVEDEERGGNRLEEDRRTGSPRSTVTTTLPEGGTTVYSQAKGG